MHHKQHYQSRATFKSQWMQKKEMEKKLYRRQEI